MKGTHRATAIRNRVTVTTMALVLGGCLSEESTNGWVEDRTADVIVTGSVGDGPLANAKIRIKTKSGRLLKEVQSDSAGTYNVTVPASESHYPLLVRASGGTDLVTDTAPDFVMRSAVYSYSPSATANVNPFSTLAYKIAKDLNGGISLENLRTAQAIVSTVTNSGLTTLKVSGVVETPIDSGNVAEMVRASETLAEIIRRTRNTLKSASFRADGDKIIEQLGSDLIDGVLEGNGGRDADPKTAAVATIVSAQVLLEAMCNDLHVNGSDATDSMRSAIDHVSSGTASPTLDDLTVTAEMIETAHTGLLAASAISGDARIEELIVALSGIQPGMDPILVRSFLPLEYGSVLVETAATVANGDYVIVDAVNDVVRSGSNPGTDVNRAPTISGSFGGSIVVGTDFTFAPSASDLDGDPLEFSIAQKPRWTEFNSTTGRLSGTPGSNDIGTYGGITITVSDGQATSHIGPFSISVIDPSATNANIILDWTPPSENEDGSALTDLAGYKIYWGTSSGAYSNSVTINNPGITSYVLDGIAPGTYKIVATSFNQAGVESARSNEITETAM